MRLTAYASVLFLVSQGQRLAAQETPRTFLESARANVVLIHGRPGVTGFGFIAGLGERTVLIATPKHVVKDTTVVTITVDTVSVCFLGRMDCTRGPVIYWSDARGSGDAALDLAVIEVSYPSRLPWRPDVMGATPTAGEPAWFIGRNQTWFLPDTPGRILSSEADSGSLLYTGLQVAEGVSGAPILVTSGIIGMHLESARSDESRGLLLETIRTRLETRLRRQWVLVPRVTCPEQDGARRVLANRWVVVRFPWYRAAPAMEAMARLRCVGALTLPSPIWESSEGEREVVYRNGDLRSARVIQTVLASLGRIEPRLGTPEGELELIVR
ncbi:MAG TPA: hypothetical protein VFS20_19555 [Longimicrobium sp.]|nr:hypothetical protein [Longimicrobium sp.]